MSEGPFYVTPRGEVLTRRQWLHRNSYVYHGRPAWPTREQHRAELRRELPLWVLLLLVFLWLCYLAWGA